VSTTDYGGDPEAFILNRIVDKFIEQQG